MSLSEELRDDPSAGKSGASPSDSGTGRKSRTVFEDPDTRSKYGVDQVPQVPPVPDTERDLEESRKPRPGVGLIREEDGQRPA